MEGTNKYLLVSHGSSDPRPQIAIEKIAEILSERLAISQKCIGTATLELGVTSLAEQICQFATSNPICNQLQIIPLFLLPGVHVKEDIPAEIETARSTLAKNIDINLLPHIGTHGCLVNLLANQKQSISATAWILMSHGSSRPGANQPVEEIAGQLGMVTAYWSVQPNLETQVRVLVNLGYHQIGILPYFLFVGGIIDAIEQKIWQLSQEFPTVEFKFLSPLGPSMELVDLILDVLK